MPTRRRAPTAGRRVPGPVAAVALLTALALAACGSVLGGPDAAPPDQSPVVAPSDLPAPVASAPRVGASSRANVLTGEDVPDGQVLAVKIDNTRAALPQAAAPGYGAAGRPAALRQAPALAMATRA